MNMLFQTVLDAQVTIKIIFHIYTKEKKKTLMLCSDATFQNSTTFNQI